MPRGIWNLEFGISDLEELLPNPKFEIPNSKSQGDVSVLLRRVGIALVAEHLEGAD
jgi:hypothetical protein